MSNTKLCNASHGLNVAKTLLADLSTRPRTSVCGAPSFAETLVSVRVRTTTVSVTQTRTEMTMEEYQAYIWEKIDGFPFHPTRLSDEQTIKIRDKCWERMKSDPEYEDRMMNIIKDGRQHPDPFFDMGSSGTYEVLDFDGGEGCHSHTWSKNYGGNKVGAASRFEKESKDGFWSNHIKRAKQRAELDAKYFAEKRMLEKISEQHAAIRAARAKQAGLQHTSSDMPIFGVPAEYLLSGLGGGAGLGL